ncbi:MAG: cell division protein FtsQ/DivIB [Candidatus Marinimicrobia bacterium]|jgi:cell division protein FtsQ|nr:cell division protein FtsQ/DivIB [Candidatus Neomarinimicrobiota bacterium]|tara:strand:- start:4510 stop:5271 length:762 start_codon:yes stop_codon:yes gene_type:complete
MKIKNNNVSSIIISSIVSVLLILLIRCSFKWSSFSQNVNISSIKITGSKLIPVEEYHKLVDSFTGISTFSTDVRKISTIIEKHSHVSSARVSRLFPRGLLIEIIERQPIAMVNASPPMLLDRHGVLFPLRGSFTDYTLPVLSHFVASDNSYPEINKTQSKSMAKAKQILHFLADNHTRLFENISELRLNNYEDFEIILLEQPTKVVLGKNQHIKKLNVLLKFENQLQLLNKSITDYKKLDLRYDSQLVAQEWI